MVAMIDACGGSGEGGYGPRMQPVFFFFPGAEVTLIICGRSFAGKGWGEMYDCGTWPHKPFAGMGHVTSRAHAVMPCPKNFA